MKHPASSLHMTVAVSAVTAILASSATIAASVFIALDPLSGFGTSSLPGIHQQSQADASSSSSFMWSSSLWMMSSSSSLSSSSSSSSMRQSSSSSSSSSKWSSMHSNKRTSSSSHDHSNNATSNRPSSSSSSSSSFDFIMILSSLPSFATSSMETQQWSSLPIGGTIGGNIGEFPSLVRSSEGNNGPGDQQDDPGRPREPNLPVANSTDTSPIRNEVPVVNNDVGVRTDLSGAPSSIPDAGGATNDPFLGCYSAEGVFIRDRAFCDPDQARHIFKETTETPQISEEEFRRTMTQEFHEQSVSPQLASLLQIINDSAIRLNGYKANAKAQGYDEGAIENTLGWLAQLDDRFRNYASFGEEVTAAAEQIKFELTTLDHKAAQNRLTTKVVLIVTHMHEAIDLCANNGINLPFETVNAYRLAEEQLKQQCPYTLENCTALAPFVDTVDNLRITMEMAIGANGREDVAEQIENLFR